MAMPTRGLRNLRTLSGRADAGCSPYRVYMQVTCLEMEKARRGSERRAAALRIAEIDTRLHEIEVEKTRLLQKMAECGVAPRQPPRSAPAAGARARFRLRY